MTATVNAGAAQGRERLQGVSWIGSRLILAARGVADVVRLVLNTPMLVRQGEHLHLDPACPDAAALLGGEEATPAAVGDDEAVA